MTNEGKFLIICAAGVVILAIIGISLKILEIIQLRETKRLKHEMEEAFFDSGIATKLGDEFQSLFGRSVTFLLQSVDWKTKPAFRKRNLLPG